MQSRTTVVKGLTVNTVLYRRNSTDPLNPPYTVTTYGFPLSWTDALNVLNGGNVHGNHKSPNAISFIRTITKNFSGYSHSIDATTEGTSSGDTNTSLTTHYSSPFNEPNNLYNEALSDLFEKLRGKIDLSIDIAQSGQAVGMFRNIKRIRGYFEAFRPGQWKKTFKALQDARRTSKAAASEWLEFQYGWKPLLTDLYESTIALTNVYPPLMKIEGRSKQVTTRDWTGPGSIDGHGVEFHRYYDSQRVLIRCEYQLGTSSTQLLSRFSSLNPVSIAWELVPYSFVFDWFLNVGDYMRNVETSILNQPNFRSGFHTFTSQRQVYANQYWSYTLGAAQVDGNFDASYVERFKSRSVLNSSPMPRAPQFEAPRIGLTRAANAISLLINFIKK